MRKIAVEITIRDLSIILPFIRVSNLVKKSIYGYNAFVSSDKRFSETEDSFCSSLAGVEEVVGTIGIAGMKGGGGDDAFSLFGTPDAALPFNKELPNLQLQAIIKSVKAKAITAFSKGEEFFSLSLTI
jgi:hypothetical protein